MQSPVLEPALKDDAFLADVAASVSFPRDRAADRLHLWWLGQSGFLLGHAGRFLLFDPYLSDSLTNKYAATDKPHVRMTARVVDPARLSGLSVILSSHNHTDHFDPDTLVPLLAASPDAKLVVPAANLAISARRLAEFSPVNEFASRLVPLAEAATTTLEGFTITTVPAAHEQLAPEFAGFVVEIGGFRVYHSGDTVLFPGLVERLRPFSVDVALLPINGRAPERRVAGNLDGPEAAQLAHAIGARCVVPCHYEMFAFNTASPTAFAAECDRLGQRRALLRAGERFTFSS